VVVKGRSSIDSRRSH